MTVKLSDRSRRVVAGMAICAALVVSSCGGSSSTKTLFVPSRIISFGDESSMIIDVNNDSNGAKFTVNAVVSSTDTTLVCGVNSIWNQSVAASFGLVFPECNPGSTAITAPPSRIRATRGARAADLGAQIDAQQADSPLGSSDMATLLIGENDVIAQYLQYPTLSEVELTANVEAAGVEAARQLNRLADLGVKVLIATIPDMGVTPFAYAERAANADTDRAALLTRLSQSFNDQLRATMYNDGRRIGLILLDELVDGIVKNPGADGITNATDPVCDLTQSKLTPPSSLDCTTLTLGARRQHRLSLGRLPPPERQRPEHPRQQRDHARAQQLVLTVAGSGRLGRSRRRQRRRVARRPLGDRVERRPRGVGVGVVDDGDDDVASARVGENVAGDADDIAQRARLQVRAPGRALGAAAACRRRRRPAASSSAPA